MFNGPVIETFKKALAEHLFEFKRTFEKDEVKEYQYSKLPCYITNGLSYSNKKHFTVLCTRDLSYDEIAFELGEEPYHWAAVEAVRASPSGYNGDEIHIFVQNRLHYEQLRNLVVESERNLKDLNDDSVCGQCEGAEQDLLKTNIEKLLSNAFIFGKPTNLDLNQANMWNNTSKWSSNTSTLGCSLIKLPKNQSYPDGYILVLKNINYDMEEVRQALKLYQRDEKDRIARGTEINRPNLNYYSSDIAYLKYLDVNQKHMVSTISNDVKSLEQPDTHYIVNDRESSVVRTSILAFKDRLRHLQASNPQHQHRSWFTGAYHIDGRFNGSNYEAFSTKKITKRELKSLVRENHQNWGYEINCIVPTFKKILHQKLESYGSHRWPVTIISEPNIKIDTIKNSLNNIKGIKDYGYCEKCLNKIEGEDSKIPKLVQTHFAIGCHHANENFIYLNHAHEGASGYSEIDGYLWNRKDYLSKLQNEDEFETQSEFVESKKLLTVLEIPNSSTSESNSDDETDKDLILIIRDVSLSETNVLQGLLEQSSSSWNRSECFLVPNNVISDNRLDRSSQLLSGNSNAKSQPQTHNLKLQIT
ncbi:hypothetical protein BN7_4564 [Wickerhamomyces ciferrii]|uniref:Uncharacterized protein n=1 Tax=Wickerhamomyces ciferrii (strain ATCC 14091 / BCRC 22168 / CBS 111 / JCM 3599 / NBRC 0793 / NRRL Y-1031 F-60-10) TaxID=1206466 RepID=K0KIE2_WICCF|nr:uncharacterized protein BN7_4564 [Wickerhamomyces ciferrii]CCH44985.1 hypothetical protein BN7_4564 [Wickerhamomyces ciferrii]